MNVREMEIDLDQRFSKYLDTPPEDKVNEENLKEILKGPAWNIGENGHAQTTERSTPNSSRAPRPSTDAPNESTIPLATSSTEQKPSLPASTPSTPEENENENST